MIESHGERSSTSHNIENGAESVSVADTTTSVATVIEEIPAVDKKAARKATKKANKERNRANRAGATIADTLPAAENVTLNEVLNDPTSLDVTAIPAAGNTSDEEAHEVKRPRPTVRLKKALCLPMETSRNSSPLQQKAVSAGTIISEAVVAAENVSSSSEVSNDPATQVLHDEVCNKTTNNGIPGLNEPVPEVTGERETSVGEISASKIHTESLPNDIIAANEHINDQYVNSAINSAVHITATPHPIAALDASQVNMSRLEEGFDAAACPEHDSSSKTEDEPKTGDDGGQQIESIIIDLVPQVETQKDKVSFVSQESEVPSVEADAPG
ncbi:hypothetical protein HDU76_005116, partial [Blyttiomyces sp. JEL0837]